MDLTVIHNGLARAAVIFSLICAAWGIFSYLRNQPISSSYWGTLAIAELLILAQSIVGFILLLGGAIPGRGVVIHLLYGITAVISLPAAYLFTKGQDTRHYNLLYALVCLWLWGISLRAITTGAG